MSKSIAPASNTNSGVMATGTATAAAAAATVTAESLKRLYHQRAALLLLTADAEQPQPQQQQQQPQRDLVAEEDAACYLSRQFALSYLYSSSSSFPSGRAIPAPQAPIVPSPDTPKPLPNIINNIKMSQQLVDDTLICRCCGLLLVPGIHGTTVRVRKVKGGPTRRRRQTRIRQQRQKQVQLLLSKHVTNVSRRCLARRYSNNNNNNDDKCAASTPTTMTSLKQQEQLQEQHYQEYNLTCIKDGQVRNCVVYTCGKCHYKLKLKGISATTKHQRRIASSLPCFRRPTTTTSTTTNTNGNKCTQPATAKNKNNNNSSNNKKTRKTTNPTTTAAGNGLIPSNIIDPNTDFIEIPPSMAATATATINNNVIQTLHDVGGGTRRGMKKQNQKNRQQQLQQQQQGNTRRRRRYTSSSSSHLMDFLSSLND